MKTLQATLKGCLGSGCGSVGRAIASDTRGQQFKSSLGQTFVQNIKTKIKKKKPGIVQEKTFKRIPTKKEA